MIGGNKYWLYAAWITWKKLQSFVRTHLSHIFALGLGILLLARERAELISILSDVHLNLVRVFLLVTSVVLMAMTIWRIREYTLPTSANEVRTVAASAILVLILGSLVLLGEQKRIRATLFGPHMSASQTFMLLLTTVTVALTAFDLQRRWAKGTKKELIFAKASNVLFAGLWLVAVIHERSQISTMIIESKMSLFRTLILSLTLATIFAALWELKGNKLTTSPQEIRFVSGMLLLLSEFERFAWGKDRGDLDPRLDEFVESFLKITCSTLCGNKKVHGALMLEVKGSNAVRLVKKTKGSNYPEELIIPTPGKDASGEFGPAGFSYESMRIVYMPVKRWKLGWPFKLMREGSVDRYEPFEATHGWIPAPNPDLENFRSVLCVPVAVYEDSTTRQAFGVLNYSTFAFDPFVDRDFIMAECFASILGQAFAVAQIEAANQLAADQSTVDRGMESQS